jgi:hypothetical protein
MPEPSMVERIARAMAPELWDYPGNEHSQGKCEVCDAERQEWLDKARAALTALQTPTPAMVEAGAADAYLFDREADPLEDMAKGVWTAMLTKAMEG